MPPGFIAYRNRTIRPSFEKAKQRNPASLSLFCHQHAGIVSATASPWASVPYGRVALTGFTASTPAMT